MATPELETTAEAIVADGKGILAADETPGTLTKRLTARGIESTPDTRRAYREMFFSTQGVAEFISGVILQDETIRQRSSKGTPMADLLAPSRESSQASKSISARNRSPASPASTSPKDSTGCAAASRNTARWARASPNGVR
jgi:fructose-bisphosphate aldolase class I